MAADATRTRKPRGGRTAAPWPDPVPEQQPRRSPGDAEGWRRVHRGEPERRDIGNVLALELDDDEWTWLDATAEAIGETPHAVLRRLIAEARARDNAETP